ncbi:MAG: AAA family ATPase [Bdellovibrionales bacterium]|nr:AAA family ATPase [Bdellovibrionales bacterium]
MNDSHDLEVALRSHTPLIVINSHEERRVEKMLQDNILRLGKPIYKWTITDGLKRLDLHDNISPKLNDATAVLNHIREAKKAGCYMLVDFHPYLDHPLRIRLLKEIVLANLGTPHTIILLSSQIEVPGELAQMAMQFELALPSRSEIERMVSEVAQEWMKQTDAQVKTDKQAFDLLIRNLTGLSLSEARRLARTAVFDDGAITAEDAAEVMKAKYDLLNRDSVLMFEYDTASFSEVAGFANLKQWLEHRQVALSSDNAALKLDKPKGILLLGVQGCGKSLAAKAVAGTWGIPLLRFDFGAIYQKFIGETEKNLRAALKSAELMAPCVLWLDELEKGLSTGDVDGGTSRRILGALLTWMAEKEEPVFIVATANDISALPPELVRKGRFDEIFFVDLPNDEVRRSIFEIHLNKRELSVGEFDCNKLASSCSGFSGAEIEQSIVSAIYSCLARNEQPNTQAVLDELQKTRPLSVVMSEKIDELRHWADGRTVKAD